MNYTYNLITSPWIPCLDLAGRKTRLGLRDAIGRAHEMRAVSGDSPLLTVAIYRLLMALLHRVYGPADEQAWEALWHAGRWDPAPLNDYLDQWRDRFDLFGAKRPFLQQKDLRVKPRSVTVLLPDFDAKDTLFVHALDEDRTTVPAGQAAQLLLAAQLFDLGGACHPQQKLYFTDSPLARCISFVLQGESLFHTLLLNLPPYPREALEPSAAEDRPAWECEDPLQPCRDEPLGRLDLYTWPSRQIWLCPEGQETAPEVAQVTISPGLSLKSDYRDPMKHYTVSSEEGYRPLQWREERALWRDSASLLQLDPASVRPVLALEWAATLVARRRVQRGLFTLAAFGMLTERGQDKIHTYLQASLPIRSAYLQDKHTVEVLREAVQLADRIDVVLRRTARDMAAHLIWPTQSDEDIVKHLASRQDRARVERLTVEWAISRRFWTPLELSFLQLLEDLPHDPEACRADWAATLRDQARAAFREVVAMLEAAPRNLKSTVVANDYLETAIRSVLNGNIIIVTADSL